MPVQQPLIFQILSDMQHQLEYGALFRYLKENVTGIDKVKLSAHCHNDLGMATANTIAAIENGADQIEGTINGIGERAGNVALEEIAVALHIRKDIYGFETDINLKEIKRTSQLVSQLTGVVIQPNKAVVGKNAFAHESGIHQDGMLKNPETYEIITPALIGESEIPLALGKHSGRHAFKDRSITMGFELSDEKLNEAFIEFKKLADRKKEITEEDLIHSLYGSTNSKFRYTSLSINECSSAIRTANTSQQRRFPQLHQAEKKCNKAATGSGSVEAIFNTLEELVEGEVHILDYRVTSIGKGRDALGEAVVNLSSMVMC